MDLGFGVGLPEDGFEGLHGGRVGGKKNGM